jgi:pimeloyl-ACP methyl ester carboxylesterase
MKKFKLQTSTFSCTFLCLTFFSSFLLVSSLSFPQENHSYVQRGDSSLKLSLYAPSITPDTGNKSDRPIILFAHGGGFSGGSRLQSKNHVFCESLKSKGFEVASIDYRLRQKQDGFNCDVTVADKREAIAWAAEDMLDAWFYLQTLGFKQALFAGSSAGAEAALFAAYNKEGSGIEGVISLSGAMESLQINNQVIPLLAFHGVCDQLVPYGRGIHHFCPENSPGALLLHGGGALPEYLPNTRLIAYENKGHELSVELLSDSSALEAIASFIRDIQSNAPIAQYTCIPF